METENFWCHSQIACEIKLLVCASVVRNPFWNVHISHISPDCVLLFLFWKHSSMKVWSRWSWVKLSTYGLFVMWLSWQGDRIILSSTFRKWLFNWVLLLTLFCFGCFLPNRLVSAIPIPHEEGFPNLSLGLNSEKHGNLAFSVLVPPLGLEDLKYLTWVI